MKLKITLVKSPISSLQKHIDTVKALGLRKIGQSVVKEDNPCIRGHDLRCKAHGQGGRNQRIRRPTS